MSKFDILKGRIYPVDMDLKIKDGETMSIRFESKVIRDVFLLSLSKKGNLRFNENFFDINELRGRELAKGVYYGDIELYAEGKWIYVTYSTNLNTPKHFDDLVFFDHATTGRWKYKDGIIHLDKKDNPIFPLFPLPEINIVV